MRGCLHNWGRWIAGALLAGLPLCVLQAADLKGVRVWAGPEHTRVVLDADGALTYDITQRDGQVVVALDDTRLDRDFTAPGAQGLFRGLSHARHGDKLELTAAVSSGSRLKSFVLEPAAGKHNYRLVLDLYPADAKVAKSFGQGVPTHVVSPTRRVAAEQAAALLGGQRQVIVVIDAGHGGKDPGSHGHHGTQEKDVTLAVARDLARQINQQPGMKAVLTRNSDIFIPLQQRYHIAREHNADLFVSIHADAFTNKSAKGSSVWVLSSRGKSSMAARWLADSQNRVDLIGGVSLDDQNDGLAKVLLDMQQGWAINASDEVANNVLKALAGLGPTHKDHVERANFVVLRSPDVPSILVETAFISNPGEERKLRDPAHQKLLAKAVMGGIKDYFRATPPPGTWFAAQAARGKGEVLASAGGHGSGAHARHKVNRGESLSSIARDYGVSVSALKRANRLDSNMVQAGAVLTIPAG